jgi:hypothetical protein
MANVVKWVVLPETVFATASTVDSRFTHLLPSQKAIFRFFTSVPAGNAAGSKVMVIVIAGSKVAPLGPISWANITVF